MDYNETIFSQKAEKYLVCYNDKCELSNRCLRRKVANYVPATRRIVESVNAVYVEKNGGKCDYFRPAEPVVMHKGLEHFYDNIPESMARAIRNKLILHFGNSNYYRYRNGSLPITAEVCQYIETVCRQNGWTGDLDFDGEATEYNW